FLAHLAPVALVGLALNVGLLAIIFWRDLVGGPLAHTASHLPAEVDRTLLVKCAFAASLVVVLWILNFSFPLVAISVGALILIIGRVSPDSFTSTWTGRCCCFLRRFSW